MDTLTTKIMTLILDYLSRRDVRQLVYTNKAISQSVISVETIHYDLIKAQFGSDLFYRAPQNTWLRTYRQLVGDPHHGRRIPVFQIQDEVEYITSEDKPDHTKSYVAFFPNEIVLSITIVETDVVRKTCEIRTLDEYFAQSEYDASYKPHEFGRPTVKRKETNKYKAGLNKYRRRFIGPAVSRAYYAHNFMLMDSQITSCIFKALRYRYIDLYYHSYDNAIAPVIYHGAITDLMSLHEIRTNLETPVNNYYSLFRPRARTEANLARYAKILPYLST